MQSTSLFLVKFDTKMDYLTHFLSKVVYNEVLCINGSKDTALSIFYHSLFALPQRRKSSGSFLISGNFAQKVMYNSICKNKCSGYLLPISGFVYLYRLCQKKLDNGIFIPERN